MKIKIFIVVLLMMSGLFWPGTGRKWVEINVLEGHNSHDVARQLISTGLIHTRVPFLGWVKLRNAGKKIQVGRYRIWAGRSAYWIVDDLIQGRVEKVRVVIPEGFASWQIAERLDELDICEKEAFKEWVKKEELEGYLFPATYDLPNGLTPKSVTQKLTAQFSLRWTPEFEARAKELGLTQSQVVTLASIIEREGQMKEELPLISAVYHNRLRKKMRLEADPTVQFAMGYWKSRLLYSDYRNTLSPYNTYLHTGLPPGPICSPGEAALRAALWPAESNALYFLAKGDGTHIFSETYREHTNQVNKRNRSRR
ncbi:MAG: Endolytic murein transglycosylase [Elusimicrobia bacterium]|nr:Endolytic murein transglycosylase [Elusimicrobiota bacterium]